MLPLCNKPRNLTFGDHPSYRADDINEYQEFLRWFNDFIGLECYALTIGNIALWNSFNNSETVTESFIRRMLYDKDIQYTKRLFDEIIYKHLPEVITIYMNNIPDTYTIVVKYMPDEERFVVYSYYYACKKLYTLRTEGKLKIIYEDVEQENGKGDVIATYRNVTILESDSIPRGTKYEFMCLQLTGSGILLMSSGNEVGIDALEFINSRCEKDVSLEDLLDCEKINTADIRLLLH